MDLPEKVRLGIVDLAKKYDIDFLGYKQVAQEDLEILIKNFIKKHKEAWEETIKNSKYI